MPRCPKDTCLLLAPTKYCECFHNSPKLETTQMPLNSRMDKYIRIPAYNGYYSAIKGNKLLIYATTGMNLKSIMLNEKSHTQKTTTV